MKRYCDFCETQQPVRVILDSVQDNTRKVARLFDIVACDVCGHCFSDPQPVDTAEVASYYPDTYYAHTFVPGEAAGLRERLKSRLRTLYYRRERGERIESLGGRILLFGLGHTVNEPPYVPGGRILDIGSGSSSYLAGLRDSGWDAYGVEPNADAVLAASHHGYQVVNGSAESTGYPDGHFDVVRMWNVLEHTMSPTKALAEVRRLLRPGGYLVLYVPNFGSYERRILGRYWMSLEIPRHLHHFTKPTLLAYLAKLGFEADRWMYPGTFFSTLLPSWRIMRVQGVSPVLGFGKLVAVCLLKVRRRMLRDYSKDVGLTLVARMKDARA